MDSETSEPKGMLFSLEDAHAKDATPKGVTDVEWNIRVREWDKEYQYWMRQMVDNSIWAVGHSKPRDAESEEQSTTEHSIVVGPRNYFGLDPSLLHDVRSEVSHHVHHPIPGGQQQRQRPSGKIIKQRKLSRLELLRYVADWDKASFGRRDMIVMDFLKTYKTKDNVYDSDSWFHCGGSLIFYRFTISLQMAFLKRRVVWHYFDALAIFVRSLQGDRYSEEFLRLGGLGFICEVIRVEVSSQADKLHACKFLVDLMKGRKSIAVKMLICDNPHFLESLVDSLTMCKDKKFIGYCGLCFENLCIEATIPNIMVLTTYVMRLLPCDFNPAIQSIAFRVLQGVIRLKPSIGTKCVKPILDNLKTEDMDLLVEMSNLSLVILQTKVGPELINQLMLVAEGIQLREQFKSVHKPHMRRGRNHPNRDHPADLQRAREKHDRVRQKMQKFDHFMQQAGALFVLNRMMTNKVDFVAEFTKQGIFGLSLKTLGSCPHWEVQGQGVTMVQFLHAMSLECATSYYLMLPEKMITLILERPAECLRYFTSPICVLLRKLGRFALRLWDRWLQKVVVPAQALSDNGMLPAYFTDMCQMTRKVYEIQNALADLLERPVMESFPKTPEPSRTESKEEEEDDFKEFLLTEDEDEEDLCKFRSGKEALFEGRTFEAFGDFLEFQAELSDEKLDVNVHKSTASNLATQASNENELGALEQAILQDAEKKTKMTVGGVGEADEGGGGGGEEQEAKGSLEMDASDKDEA